MNKWVGSNLSPETASYGSSSHTHRAANKKKKSFFSLSPKSLGRKKKTKQESEQQQWRGRSGEKRLDFASLSSIFCLMSLVSIVGEGGTSSGHKFEIIEPPAPSWCPN